MKRITIFVLLCIICFIAKSETRTVGVGYTFDTGLHFRLKRFEAQIIFGDVTLYGLRFYPFEKSVMISSFLNNFYAGFEADIVQSKLLDGGYVAGIFGGLDKSVFKNLHLSLDIGFYMASLKGLETVNDTGIIISTKLTYYLGGGKK